jgi:hypothetical protein
MIEITRSLARRLSAVVRGCFRKPYYPHSPVVDFHTDGHGLCVRAAHADVAVEYRQPGSLRPDRIVLPLDALAAVEGRDDTPVVLEDGEVGQTVARWDDGGVPQVMAFALPEGAALRPAVLDLPAQFIRNSGTLLTALAEAARSAADEESRYAMHRIQLRGAAGEVVGTNSKELYIDGGYTFGWGDEVLVPKVAAFGRPEFGPAEAVEVGRTEGHVVLGIGPWTIYLAIDTAGRYPPVDAVVPKPGAATTTCRFAPEDAAFLLRAMPRLPGKADENKPVTLDLNGQVCVRARAADQPQTAELILSRTSWTGDPARLNLNRDNLARALQLGFTDLSVVKPDRPVICRDEHRTFLMMPLDASGALPPGENPLRVDSDGERPRRRDPQPKTETNAMSTPSTNGVAPASTPTRRRTTNTAPAAKNRIGLAALIADAQALRDSARDTFGRAGRLLVALKRHRQQSRLVASTLKSLKQLHTIDG